jgi:uncharacterized protein YfiM (DUF2279 family)
MVRTLILLVLLTTIPASAQLLTEPDKKMHFAAGAFTSALGYAVAYEFTKDKDKAVLYGIGTAVLIGTLKEMSDSTQSGNYFDGRDLLATTYGGISVGITIDLIRQRKQTKFTVLGIKF